MSYSSRTLEIKLDGRCGYMKENAMNHFLSERRIKPYCLAKLGYRLYKDGQKLCILGYGEEQSLKYSFYHDIYDIKV